MRRICKKCGKEVPEGEVVEIAVELRGGRTLEPQIFEHKNCGGEVVKEHE